MVPENLDVGGNEVGNGGIGTAEHDVLSRRFQMAVHDRERPVAVPGSNSLRIGPSLLEVGQPRVHDGRVPGVHGDPAPGSSFRIAVQPASVEDDMVRQGFEGSFGGAEQHQVDEKRAFLGPDLESDEAVVVRPFLRDDHRIRRSHELRHRRRARRVDPSSRRRQRSFWSVRLHHDPSRPRLAGQLERPLEARPGLQRDLVSRGRRAEGGLQIAPSRHADRAARGGADLHRFHRLPRRGGGRA